MGSGALRVLINFTLISGQLMNFTSEIKVDINFNFKEHFWRILKTTLISRQLVNFTSKMKVDFNRQRTVLVYFENNLDFKTTHEFYLKNQG